MGLWRADFQKGDIIDFCGERFEVIDNYGWTGKVRENFDGGMILPMHWEYAGERCTLVKRAERAIESTESA